MIILESLNVERNKFVFKYELKKSRKWEQERESSQGGGEKLARWEWERVTKRVWEREGSERRGLSWADTRLF